MTPPVWWDRGGPLAIGNWQLAVGHWQAGKQGSKHAGQLAQKLTQPRLASKANLSISLSLSLSW